MKRPWDSKARESMFYVKNRIFLSNVLPCLVTKEHSGRFLPIPTYLYLPTYSFLPILTYQYLPTYTYLHILTYLYLPTNTYLPILTYLYLPTYTYLPIPIYLYLPTFTYFPMPNLSVKLENCVSAIPKRPSFPDGVIIYIR